MIPQPEECISPNQKAAPSGAAFACQKSLAEIRGPQAANRVQFIFRGGMYVAKILCAERVCPNGLKAYSDARVGAKTLVQKRARPFCLS